MRRWIAPVIVLLLLALPPAARAGQADTAVLLTAQRIALYADRGILLAEGGVSIHGPQLQLEATRLVYDLKANRLTTDSGYVYDFGTKRGRRDANASVPQLSSAEATAVAQQAELQPAQTISLTNAQVRSGAQFVPMASYTYAIPSPSAKDFGYSPVPSAALEWPFVLTSAADSYSFARARYDRYNGGPGAGLEEHYAKTDRGYVAAGQTLDIDGARLDLAAFQRLNGALTQSLTGSRLTGATAVRYALSSSGRQGYAALSFAQYNGTRSDDLYVTGNQHGIGRLASFRLQADLGHDVHPVDYGGAQDFRLTPGVHVDSATLRIAGAALSTSADLGESVYDYGRGTLASALSFWGSYPAGTRLLLNAGASFAHDAAPFPSTLRTYTAGMSLKRSERFNVVTSLQRTDDYGQVRGFGRPQYAAAFDLTIRRKDGRGIEIGGIMPFGAVGNLYRAAVFNLRFVK
ncbi:MAG: hypothetical protein ACXWNJ_01810 [Vulcanimicrobiaceae bacterium]